MNAGCREGSDLGMVSLSRCFRVEKCKVMDSKMRPLWVVFENQDSLGDDILQIFKNGDGEWTMD